VSVASQLGALSVDTGKLTSFLTPTAENAISPPLPITVTEVDRFACYQAKVAKGAGKLPKNLEITIADAFTQPPKRVVVQKLLALCTPVTPSGDAPKHGDYLLCFKAQATKGQCAGNATINAGRGCKKESDCGGIKGQTTFCSAQAKFTKVTGLHVANDLDAGTLDAAKDDVICLPAVRLP
jgi:hypothetical protein